MCFRFFFALSFLYPTKRKTNEKKGDAYTSEKVNFDMLIIIMASREREEKNNSNLPFRCVEKYFESVILVDRCDE